MASLLELRGGQGADGQESPSPRRVERLMRVESDFFLSSNV